MARQEELNYFAVMGLGPNATEVDIRKAYRKLSLALHPDKNRTMDPEIASARFHEMQLAYEILMDPAARLAAAERNKVEALRKERRGAYEGKRKEMAEELEKREEEERLKRFRGAQDEQKRKGTLEKLREEGRRLREQKEQKAIEVERALRQDLQHQQAHRQHLEKHEVTSAPEAIRDTMPELGPLDMTVRLRFPADQFIELSASSSSSTSSTLASPLGRGLESRFGKLDSLIFKEPNLKREGKKAPKEVTAHATFKTLDAAFAAVKAGNQLRAGGSGLAAVLEDVWIGWAAGSRNGTASADGSLSGEPERISWLRKHNKLALEGDVEAASHHTVEVQAEDDILSRMKRANGAINGKSTSNGEGKDSSRSLPHGDAMDSPIAKHGPAPSIDVFESSTLQKMREAERKRMEQAILQMDEQ